jgi:hypothetical protein
MNLILFEPEGDMTRREIGSRSSRAVKHLVQFLDGIDEEIAFFFADRCDVSADSIAEHDGLLRQV